MAVSERERRLRMLLADHDCESPDVVARKIVAMRDEEVARFQPARLLEAERRRLETEIKRLRKILHENGLDDGYA